MSATNRGAVRQPNDNYPTPEWCVRALLDAVPLPGGRWLEPCAGDGAIMRAVRRPDVIWTGYELRLLDPVPNNILCGVDFLSVRYAYRMWDVALTNPPYRLAREFVEGCRYLATHTVFLLRLNFLAGQARRDWLAGDPPDVYVLPRGPSFSADGRTDATEYAWFHWGPNTNGRIRWLSI